MGYRNTTDGKVRAGLFEIDLSSGELYKSGRKIALQQLPFRVLWVLIERPGEVVSREELRRRLWPSDTFGAFDEGLNTAMSKLRAAFGDSADNPRFIETVPRRGYRFIAPLTRNGNGSVGTAGNEGDVELPATGPAARYVSPQVPESTGKPGPALAAKRRPLQALAAGVVLACLLLAAWSFRPTLPPPHVLRVRQLTRLGNLQAWLYSDGPRIYFKSVPYDVYGQWRSISVEGGESSPANDIKSDWYVQDFSPNGSELLILQASGRAPFWKVFFPSGSMQALDPTPVSGPSPGNAVWSPDGESIAFVDDFGLYIMKSDGSKVRKVATFEGSPARPVWSPDGHRIRLTVEKIVGSSSLMGRTVMEVEVASGASHPVALGVDSPRALGWLRGGNYFLFTSRESGVTNIWAIRETPDGLRKVDRRPVRLTAGPISFDWPVMGRDGKTMFVVGSLRRAEMQRYDRKTGQFEPFLGGGFSGNTFTYSRDGKWFAYLAYPERTLWRCRADGQQRLQLTFGPMQMDWPSWSPDGKQIAFNTRGLTRMSKGYLIPPNGGAPQLLFPESSTGEERLSWSPDGKRIMYSEVSPSAPLRLRILDLSTRQITDVPDSEGLAGDWSPDGDYIAAHDASGNLKLFDLQTRRWTDLGLNAEFWWSMDGQYLYFHTLNRTPLDRDRGGLFRMRISDGHVEKVLGIPPFQLAGTFGAGTGMTPDGAPLLQKDLTTSDAYALDLDLP